MVHIDENVTTHLFGKLLNILCLHKLTKIYQIQRNQKTFIINKIIN